MTITGPMWGSVSLWVTTPWTVFPALIDGESDEPSDVMIPGPGKAKMERYEELNELSGPVLARLSKELGIRVEGTEG